MDYVKLFNELNAFINLLMVVKILFYNKQDEQSIIKTNETQFNRSNIIFLTFKVV